MENACRELTFTEEAELYEEEVREFFLKHPGDGHSEQPMEFQIMFRGRRIIKKPTMNSNATRKRRTKRSVKIA